MLPSSSPAAGPDVLARRVRPAKVLLGVMLASVASTVLVACSGSSEDAAVDVSADATTPEVIDDTSPAVTLPTTSSPAPTSTAPTPSIAAPITTAGATSSTSSGSG